MKEKFSFAINWFSVALMALFVAFIVLLGLVVFSGSLQALSSKFAWGCILGVGVLVAFALKGVVTIKIFNYSPATYVVSLACLLMVCQMLLAFGPNNELFTKAVYMVYFLSFVLSIFGSVFVLLTLTVKRFKNVASV